MINNMTIRKRMYVLFSKKDFTIFINVRWKIDFLKCNKKNMFVKKYEIGL